MNTHSLEYSGSDFQRKSLTSFPFRKSTSACNCGRFELQDLPHLCKILPEDYDYKLCDYISLENEGQFLVTLRMKLSSKEEALEWKRRFEEKSLTTHVLDKSFPKVGRVSVFKVQYRCQFFDRRKNKNKVQSPEKSKFRDCHSILFINIKKFFKNTLDHHMPLYCTILRLHYAHSHPLDTADVLRKRGLNPGIQQRFLEMYQRGTKPKDALDIHKRELLQKLGPEKYRQVVCDGYYVPNLSKVYRLYYQFHGKGVSAKTSTKRSSRHNPSADWLAFQGCPGVTLASEEEGDNGDGGADGHRSVEDEERNDDDNSGGQFDKEQEEVDESRVPLPKSAGKDLNMTESFLPPFPDPPNNSSNVSGAQLSLKSSFGDSFLSRSVAQPLQLPSTSLSLSSSAASALDPVSNRPGVCVEQSLHRQCQHKGQSTIHESSDVPTNHSNAPGVPTASSSCTSVQTCLSQGAVPNCGSEDQINCEDQSSVLFNPNPPSSASGETGRETIDLLSPGQPHPWGISGPEVHGDHTATMLVPGDPATPTPVVRSHAFQHQHYSRSAGSTRPEENQQQQQDLPHQAEQFPPQGELGVQPMLVHPSQFQPSNTYPHPTHFQVPNNLVCSVVSNSDVSHHGSGISYSSSLSSMPSTAPQLVSSSYFSPMNIPNTLDCNYHHHYHQHCLYQFPPAIPCNDVVSTTTSSNTDNSPSVPNSNIHGHASLPQAVASSPVLCPSSTSPGNARETSSEEPGKSSGALLLKETPKPHALSSHNKLFLRRRTGRAATVKRRKAKKKTKPGKELNMKLITKHWLEQKPRVEAETQSLASELMGDILLRERAEKLKVRLLSFLSGLEFKLTSDPKLFVPALEKFLQAGESARDDLDLAALLREFGKTEASLLREREGRARELACSRKTQTLLSGALMRRVAANLSIPLKTRRRRKGKTGVISSTKAKRRNLGSKRDLG